MKTVKWIFRAAGIYGVLIVAPMIFLEGRVAEDFPPAITHPEYYYGFIATCLPWQLMYLLISTDPVRYRAPMLIGMSGKAMFFLAVAILFAQGRVPGSMLAMVTPDAILAAIFIYAWRLTPKA